MTPSGSYTTKIVGGKRYWYHDGKRVAVAKVPLSVRQGKTNNSIKKSPSKYGVSPQTRQNLQDLLAEMKAEQKSPNKSTVRKSPKRSTVKKATVRKAPVKKTAVKKVSISHLQDNCHMMTKKEILGHLAHVDKSALCEAIRCMKREPVKVSKTTLKKKRDAYLNDLDSSGEMCIGQPIPRCPESYCSKSKRAYVCF